MSRITPLPRDPLPVPDEAHLELADALVPLAARLVAAVRDEGPDVVRALLTEVPPRAGESVPAWDALAVILAGMADPDRSPRELLGWSLAGPVPTLGPQPPILFGSDAREHGSEKGYRQHETHGEEPCDPCRAAHADARAA